MHIDVLPSTLPLLLPPLTLQLLIENAVKHNVISTSKPLQITISQRGSQLIVANNLQPKVQVVNTDGFGLKNINQQYKLLGYPPIDVQQVQGVFSVALPLISTK
jgi:LytS/YehU family sensor histidine kinase